MINLYNQDCMQAMREAPDNYWDLAIVDPPYGIGISKIKTYGAAKNRLTFYKPKNWDNSIPSKEYFEELKRVSKNQMIFGANFFIEHLSPSKCWVCWDKKIGDNYYSMHELIYTSFSYPAKIIRLHNGANRVSNNPELAKKYLRIHPTQKPIPLYEWLLSRYAKKGDKILDTHLGSGSSAIAAHRMGFAFDGYEIDKDYFEGAKARLEQAQRQLLLFG